MIVKIVPSGADADVRHGRSTPRVEAQVYSSGIVGRLTSAVTTPELLAVDELGPETWLWLRDVGDLLDVARDVDAAERSVVAVAELNAHSRIRWPTP